MATTSAAAEEARSRLHDAAALAQERIAKVRSAETQAAIGGGGLPAQEAVSSLSWVACMLLSTSEEALRKQQVLATAENHRLNDQLERLQRALASSQQGLEGAVAERDQLQKEVAALGSRIRKEGLTARQRQAKDAAKIQQLTERTEQQQANLRLSESAWAEERRAEQAAGTQRERNMQAVIVKLQQEVDAIGPLTPRANGTSEPATAHLPSEGSPPRSTGRGGTPGAHAKAVAVAAASASAEEAAALRARVSELQMQCDRGVALIERLKGRLQQQEREREGWQRREGELCGQVRVAQQREAAAQQQARSLAQPAEAATDGRSEGGVDAKLDGRAAAKGLTALGGPRTPTSSKRSTGEGERALRLKHDAEVKVCQPRWRVEGSPSSDGGGEGGAWKDSVTGGWKRACAAHAPLVPRSTLAHACLMPASCPPHTRSYPRVHSRHSLGQKGHAQHSCLPPPPVRGAWCVWCKQALEEEMVALRAQCTQSAQSLQAANDGIAAATQRATTAEESLRDAQKALATAEFARAEAEAARASPTPSRPGGSSAGAPSSAADGTVALLKAALTESQRKLKVAQAQLEEAHAELRVLRRAGGLLAHAAAVAGLTGADASLAAHAAHFPAAAKAVFAADAPNGHSDACRCGPASTGVASLPKTPLTSAGREARVSFASDATAHDTTDTTAVAAAAVTDATPQMLSTPAPSLDATLTDEGAVRSLGRLRASLLDSLRSERSKLERERALLGR